MFNPNITLIFLSHLHHQISIKLKAFFPSERATPGDTARGIQVPFIYLKWGRKNDVGPKVLIKQSYFMEDPALSPYSACEVDLKSWLVLLIWGWVRPICHLVRKGKWGGTFFNCQVTWCRDRRSFGHIVCLCVRDQPSEIPHLIMRKERLIDQFTNWQPQDWISLARELTN